MNRLEWRSASESERAAALARPQRRRDGAVLEVVRRIFADVESSGAEGVRKWALKLDLYEPREIALTKAVVDAARAKIAGEDLAALEVAADQVRRYHEFTTPRADNIEVSPGVRVRRLWRPIPICGLYAPGGTAPLFSTLLMLAEPARAAGVKQRIVVTPPGGDGEIHPMMLAAGAATGLDAIFALGGAQAIAALTFGAGLAKADKICGPGNAYVSEAKRFAASLPGGPAIDLPAGPSELMVIADARGKPCFRRRGSALASRARRGCASAAGFNQRWLFGRGCGRTRPPSADFAAPGDRAAILGARSLAQGGNAGGGG